MRAAVGAEAGPTDWVTIEQSRVDAFADATDDHQWIHVDPVRAAAGPFGSTIAHGYSPCRGQSFLRSSCGSRTRKMGVNYGTDKVRSPPPFGWVRASAAAPRSRASDVPGGVQIHGALTIEAKVGTVRMRGGHDQPFNF